MNLFFGRKKIYPLFGIPLGAGLILLSLCLPVMGQDPRVLIINSNHLVDKYKMAQQAFVNAFPFKPQYINLEAGKPDILKVRNKIELMAPDLIYCLGTKAYLVSQAFPGNIVFSSILNWMKLPLTEKSYGVSNEIHAGMQLMLFRLVFPSVKKIGVLYSVRQNQEWFQNMRKEANVMGIQIVGFSIDEKKSPLPRLEQILPLVDVFWLISDPVLMSDKKTVLDLLKGCDHFKKPIFSYSEVFIDYGAILIISVDAPTIGRQIAAISLDLIHDEAPKEKVQYPAGTHIILNLKKVKAYQFPYNVDALDSVNQIIE